LYVQLRKRYILLAYDIQLQELNKKHHILPIAVRAMKQRKKKFLIRFTEVEKRLARSKINQYRANILKEIEAISYHFNFLDLKNNTDIITRIIAYKEVVEQLMKIINITESTTFFDVLMLFKNIDLNADNSIQALDR
jgi:hypothetical protein